MVILIHLTPGFSTSGIIGFLAVKASCPCFTEIGETPLAATEVDLDLLQLQNNLWNSDKEDTVLDSNVEFNPITTNQSGTWSLAERNTERNQRNFFNALLFMSDSMT